MKTMRSLGRAAVGLVLLCGATACPGTRDAALRGATDSRIWFVNDPDSTEAIDHGAWDSIVAAYLKTDPDGDGVNRFDYRAVSDADRRKLRDYLRHLGSIDIAAYNRDEQIAFWMNLYNAAIADVVLDNLPVGSVLEIRGPGINVAGPWLRPIATIYGRTLSFDDVEHRILRVAFNDMGIPIHYGVNCASQGCPALAPRAHTAENWRENLKATARQFVNCPHGVRLNDGELRTSRIYHSWFPEDFGSSDADTIAHLAEYAEPELAEGLKAHSSIAGDFYDWRLNAVE